MKKSAGRLAPLYPTKQISQDGVELFRSYDFSEDRIKRSNRVDSRPRLAIELENFIDTEMRKLGVHNWREPPTVKLVTPERLSVFETALRLLGLHFTPYTELFDSIIREYKTYTELHCSGTKKLQLTMKYLDQTYARSVEAIQHASEVTSQQYQRATEEAKQNEEKHKQEAETLSEDVQLWKTKSRENLNRALFLQTVVDEQKEELQRERQHSLNLETTVREHNIKRTELGELQQAFESKRYLLALEREKRESAEQLADELELQLSQAGSSIKKLQRVSKKATEKLRVTNSENTHLSTRLKDAAHELLQCQSGDPVVSGSGTSKTLTPRPNWKCDVLIDVLLKEVEEPAGREYQQSTSAKKDNQLQVPDANNPTEKEGMAMHAADETINQQDNNNNNNDNDDDDDDDVNKNMVRLRLPSGAGDVEYFNEKRNQIISELSDKSSSENVNFLIQLILKQRKLIVDIDYQLSKTYKIQEFLRYDSHRPAQERKQTGGRFFVGLGNGPTVEKYLKFSGKISNKQMSKKATDTWLRNFWSSKQLADKRMQEKNRVRVEFHEFLYGYLVAAAGLQAVVCETAYNVLDSCKRYRHNPECALFLQIQTNKLSDEAFYYTKDLLAKLEHWFVKLETTELASKSEKTVEARLLKSQTTGFVSKKYVFQELPSIFPCKTSDDLLKIKLCFQEENPGKQICYSKLFDSSGQSMCISIIREQVIRELQDYIKDIQEALIDASDDGCSIVAFRAQMVLQEVDPCKSSIGVEKMMSSGLNVTEDDLSKDDIMTGFVNISSFCTSLLKGFTTRATNPEDVQGMLSKRGQTRTLGQAGRQRLRSMRSMTSLLHEKRNDSLPSFPDQQLTPRG